MKIYYYVHTGHRIGLDRFRRSAAIIKSLKEFDITLLSSDFRIAQISNEYGVENSVGIDVVRNIPYIAQHQDILIFDSDEANPIMLEDMKKYFSKFIHIKNNEVMVDEIYFDKRIKTIDISFFFGDDDYEKDLEKYVDILDTLDLNLQLGFYYFLDYEDMLKSKFKKHTEFEEYAQMVLDTDILITSSPQAVLESLASNGRPIYFKRDDYVDDFDSLFNDLNIPILEQLDTKKLNDILENIDNYNYMKIDKKSNSIVSFLRNNLKL